MFEHVFYGLLETVKGKVTSLPGNSGLRINWSGLDSTVIDL